jgi:hypothetical protein
LKIRYLKHKEIDIKKWNISIARSVNEIVYANSWYLDIVSENWDALVEGDYESVMPLTHKKKYGIQYLAQPDYTQQLGVFSSKKIDAVLVEKFLRAIPKKYKIVQIKLNTINKIESDIFDLKPNANFHLDLIEPYEILQKKYSKNTKRNLNQAKKHGIYLSKGITTNELVKLFVENVGDTLIGMKKSQYDILRRLIAFFLKNNLGKIYAAYDSSNTLCGAVFFILAKKKITSLITVSSPEGKKNKSVFLIFDHIIKLYSEKHMTLDFEGSNIPGIARFNKGFGATACEYMGVNINRLPWILRIFKK